MGWARGETGLKVHSRESESGVPGVEGVRRSDVHMRLDSGESASSQRRLPGSRLGRLTGLKLDARIAMGERLRRVVYFRVGDGDTTGENLEWISVLADYIRKVIIYVHQSVTDYTGLRNQLYFPSTARDSSQMRNVTPWVE